MKRRNFLQLLAASAAGAALTMSSAEAKNTGRRVRISAGNRTWYATLDDNATTRALIAKLPLTLPLEDLYGRELCYRFRDALPANEVSYRGYEVGEIVLASAAQFRDSVRAEWRAFRYAADRPH